VFEAGERVGDYRIVAQLATGPVTDVYTAEHVDTGAKVAVEALRPDAAANAAGAARYLATMRTLARIRHAGALRLLQVVDDDEPRPYVIAELLDGQPLARRIEETGRMSATQIGDIGRQLANLLAALHDDDVMHGDLRPDAIICIAQAGLARGEPIKVIEFGLAELKRTLGIPIGPVYSAPEQLRAGDPVDWRADAYALGCVAFEMATGRPPFRGASADEVRAKHLEHLPPAARSLMPDVPPALDQLVGRLLSKQPTDRFASMREIARAFDTIGAGGGGGTRPLANTARDQPVVVLGELGLEATSGEIVARPQPAPPPEIDPGASVSTILPATVTEAPPPRAITPPSGATASLPRLPPAPGRRVPMLAVVLAVVVLFGGAVGLVLALR
jgi:eukaryotic-like serine/threonine-protein kinase